jgi:hypothetical protein
MKDLIERLEKATEPSRILDAQIYIIVNSAYEPTGRVPGEVRYKAGGHPFACPRYSESLDAATQGHPPEEEMRG